MRRSISKPDTLIIPLLLLILLVGIAPFASAVYGSFFHDTYDERSCAGLDNYRDLLSDRGFLYSVSVTALWAAANTALSLAMGFLCAAALARPGRGSSLLYGVLLVPWGIPVYIAAPLWRALIHGNGGRSLLSRLTGAEINLMTDPAGSFLSALWVSLWMTVPLTAFVILGAIRKVRAETIDAARLDGARWGDIVTVIFSPAVKETLLAMGVLTFIKGLKEFTLLHIFTAGGPPLVSGITERSILGATTTAGIYLYDLFFGEEDFGAVSAYSVILSIGILAAMSVWLLIRRRKSGGRRRPFPMEPSRMLSLLCAVFHLFLGGRFGPLWAAAYTVTAFLPKALAPAAAGELILMVVAVSRNGFFQGFHPAVILSVLAAGAFLFRRPPEPGAITRGVYAFSHWTTALLLCVSTLLIIFMLLWMSFSGVSACYVDRLIPRFLTGKNFIRLITQESIFRYFLNTTIVAGATALLIPLFTFPTAVWLSGKSDRFVYGFLTFVQALGMLGGMHSLVPLYGIFRGMGLIGTYVPLVCIYLNQTVVFSLFTMKAFLDGVPRSIEETALLEGMGGVRYMTRILLPICMPAIATSMMMAFLSAWNGFMAPLLFLDNDEAYTISLKLFSYVGSVASGNPRWNLFAAASVINCVILGILFSLFRKPGSTTPLSEYAD
jgi:multiple sugar transport system permease protein